MFVAIYSVSTFLLLSVSNKHTSGVHICILLHVKFCVQPDSEEGNEMVFCDSCNICVHQACYGITTIPSGSWLCRTCALSLRPECVLCPNKGGAMKCTRSGQKWAHVSCALWIPEVSIGCVERMEPITKISSIPVSLSWVAFSFAYLNLLLFCYLRYSDVLHVCSLHCYVPFNKPGLLHLFYGVGNIWQNLVCMQTVWNFEQRMNKCANTDVYKFCTFICASCGGEKCTRSNRKNRYKTQLTT